MKFTVEVEDFYLEEDELSVSLQTLIKHDIANQINALIKDRVKSLIDAEIRQEVETKLEVRVSTLINEVSANVKIKGRYSTDPEMSIAEYIKFKFNEVDIKSKTSEKLEDDLKKLVKAQSEKTVLELKNRYDVLFATQIVQKLNEQGMLKENVAKILLEGNKP